MTSTSVRKALIYADLNRPAETDPVDMTASVLRASELMAATVTTSTNVSTLMCVHQTLLTVRMFLVVSDASANQALGMMEVARTASTSTNVSTIMADVRSAATINLVHLNAAARKDTN